MVLKKSLEDYRRGAAGALLDEYERAAHELRAILYSISEEAYTYLADAETKDEDCRSIATVMNHVARAGHSYANYIRTALSLNSTPVEIRLIPQREIGAAIDNFLAYTAEIFNGRAAATDDELENVTFTVRWGPVYNIEQLLEHAIVHILRHRRQIEKFILKYEAQTAIN